jgi:hypothetical protein
MIGDSIQCSQHFVICAAIQGSEDDILKNWVRELDFGVLLFITWLHNNR